MDPRRCPHKIAAQSYRGAPEFSFTCEASGGPCLTTGLPFSCNDLAYVVELAKSLPDRGENQQGSENFLREGRRSGLNRREVVRLGVLHLGVGGVILGGLKDVGAMA